MAQSLLTESNIVQVPIIIVTFGDGEDAVTFGYYDKKHTQVQANGQVYSTTKVTYPNYVQSLNVKKINGTVNTYTLVIVYPITQDDDPEMFNKVTSRIQESRSITLTYGDGALPEFVYKKEEAIITDAKKTYDYNGLKLTYTINAVSSGVLSASGTYTFPGYTNKKPSDVIKSMLYNNSYGLTDIFYGMKDREMVEQLGLIPGNDLSCRLEKQTNMTVLNYISYLVSCMSKMDEDVNSREKTTQYVWTCSDETSGILNGPYFQIYEVLSAVPSNSSIAYYEVGIGFPSKDLVLDFSVTDNEAYSLLYQYDGEINRSDYVYRIGDDGEIQQIYSPSISNNSETLRTTAAEKSWWNSVTSYPISAELSLKGLLMSVTLMSYIRLEVRILGHKTSDSGLYIITEENDEVSASGYKTTLSLIRVGEDE